MPSRVTVDENGFVVSVDPMPERHSLEVRSKRGTSEKPNKKAATRKLLSRAPGLGALKMSACPVCGTQMYENRMGKHLRKAHPEANEGTSRSQSQQLKSRIAYTSGKKAMSLCSICNVHVRKDRWDRHVRKVHSSDPENVVQRATEQSKAKLKQSPTRNLSQPDKPAPRNVDKGNLKAVKRAKIAAKEATGRKQAAEKVRRKLRAIGARLKELAPGFHAARIEELRREQKILQKELKDLERTEADHTTNKRRAQRIGKPSTTSGYHEDDISSSNETRYGGKHLGQVRRDWDGKFGSLPLYDDYGEESDPS